MSNLEEIITDFKNARIKEGLSSKTITGNKGNDVYRMEQGAKNPRIDTFAKWCDKIGLKIKLVKK